MKDVPSEGPMHHWQEYQRGLPYSEPARYAIIESWDRSAKAGLIKGAALSVPLVPDFHGRLTKCSALIRAATPHLQRLLSSLTGTTNVAYVTDADGVVLTSFGAIDQLSLFHLTPGYDWSERAMGTNGVGTALATKCAIAVVGPDHYLDALSDCTCTAAPIFGHDRSLVGAIDVSSSVRDALPNRLSSVIATAQEIERELYAAWRRTLSF